MEKQESQGKTPENEEKKNYDYTQLRECIDDAEKEGLSFFFVAADDKHVIQVADYEKKDLVPAFAYTMNKAPSLKMLLMEALDFSAFMDKIMD